MEDGLAPQLAGSQNSRWILQTPDFASFGKEEVTVGVNG